MRFYSARRISELQRRRKALIAQQEQLRAKLPDWAIEPLRLVGMTGDEIRTLVNDMSTAEAESGLEEIERQLDSIDQEIEEMESLLVATRSKSLEEIEAVARLTVARFHEIIVTDPNDVFYDHGEARLVALVERGAGGSQRSDPAVPVRRRLNGGATLQRGNAPSWFCSGRALGGLTRQSDFLSRAAGSRGRIGRPADDCTRLLADPLSLF